MSILLNQQQLASTGSILHVFISFSCVRMHQRVRPPTQFPVTGPVTFLARAGFRALEYDAATPFCTDIWSPAQQQLAGARSHGSTAGRIPQTAFRLVKKKQRLDELCVERFPQYSRTMVQSWILQGKVTIDGKPVWKAGTPVHPSSDIVITAEVPKFVCRAGYKLEAAIEHFSCDVQGKVALDAGLSTGGFTDCLLQNGAIFVYGVDVGYGQVADKIRKDKRVCVMERTNLRYLKDLPQLVDVVTLDLAFISVLLVMPAVCSVMKPQATLVTLIKPQFEAQRWQVGRGGVVRDEEVHKEVISKVVQGVEGCGFICKGWMESPLRGADGNIEFLALFSRQSDKGEESDQNIGELADRL